MKIIIGTLLLTFSVLFNSIELSSQSINNRNTSPPQGELRTIQVENLPVDEVYVLPNGNYYVSRGTGPITILYNTATQVAMVGQARFPAVYIGRRNTSRSTSTQFSNNRANGHSNGHANGHANGHI